VKFEYVMIYFAIFSKDLVDIGFKCKLLLLTIAILFNVAFTWVDYDIVIQYFTSATKF
jgi:hypothetical protein